MVAPPPRSRPGILPDAGRVCFGLLAALCLVLAFFAVSATAQPGASDEPTTPSDASARRTPARSLRLPPTGGFTPSGRYLDRFSSSLPDTRLPVRREWREQFNYSIVSVMNDLWQSRQDARDSHTSRALDSLRSGSLPGTETSYGGGSEPQTPRRPRVRATPRYSFPELPVFYRKVRTFEAEGEAQ